MYRRYSRPTDPNAPARYRAVRLLPGVALLAALLMMALASATASAQRIDVAGLSDLRLGNIDSRRGGLPVSYTSDGAAQFSIRGEAGRPVRIAVYLAQLQQTRGIMIQVATSDCRFSNDGGITWRAFQTEDLSLETSFPSSAEAGMGGMSYIHVRIGGSVSIGTGAYIRRGELTSSMRLTASYLD